MHLNFVKTRKQLKKTEFFLYFKDNCNNDCFKTIKKNQAHETICRIYTSIFFNVTAKPHETRNVAFSERGTRLRHNFPCFFVGSVKRYSNRTLTRTCSMVRGPDEKPEVERLGVRVASQWSSVRVLVPKRVNSSRRSTFVVARKGIDSS